MALKFYQPKMQSLFGVSNSESAARRSAATGMRLFKVMSLARAHGQSKKGVN